MIYRAVDIRVGSASSDPFLNQTKDIDINGNGQIDWTIGTRSSQSFASLGLIAPSATRFIYRTIPDAPSLGTEVAPLASGFLVSETLEDPLHSFLTILEGLGGVLSAFGGDEGSSSGAFGGKSAYLGFQFEIEGQAHFGYAFLEDVNASSAIISSYAWESEPDTAILTGAIPEPTSVTLLLISAVVPLLRRSRT